MWSLLRSFLVSALSSVIMQNQREPAEKSLNDPTNHFMKNTMDIRIPILHTSPHQELGAWYSKPFDGTTQEAERKVFDDNFLAQENEVAILYLHGNAGTRANYGRRML